MMHPKTSSTLLGQFIKEKLLLPEELGQFRQQTRQGGKTIATLNGSFDLMHSGHLHIIYEASLQADYLVVGLNTDESIKQYKSLDRPIISLDNRLSMMAAIEFVDYVSWFPETDPRKWLRLIQPDIHVNGVEYGNDCIEMSTLKEMGSKIHLVDRIPGLSTTEVIKKVQSLCD